MINNRTVIYIITARIKIEDNCHDGKQVTNVKICNLSHVTKLVSKPGHKSGPGYNHGSNIDIYKYTTR